MRRRWLASAGNAWGGHRRRASAAPAPVGSWTGGVAPGGGVGVHTHSRARVNIQRNSLHNSWPRCVALAEEMDCQ